MLESIFIILGMTIFIKLLFDKWDIWHLIYELGSRTHFEWVYKLTNCQFCILFWIGYLMTIVYGVANELFWGLLVVPFIVSGLIHLIYQR